MITKIDFIISAPLQNSRVAALTKQIANAFSLEGIQTRTLISPEDKNPDKFIQDLMLNAPDCTISLNGILPTKAGLFLADLLQIPHVSILTDSPNAFLELAKSKYTIICCIDAFFTEFFKRAGSKKSLFLPFEAPIINEMFPQTSDRSIDLLMIPELIDTESILSEWKRALPEKMVTLLERAKERSLLDPVINFYPAFLDEFNKLSTQEIEDYKKFINVPLLYELEMSIRAADQLELLASLEGLTVDLLIIKGTKPKWEKILLGLKTRFRFHERSSFDTMGQILKESKIFLHSSPHIKRGTDGMVYTSLLYGAYAITNHTPYLEEEFHEDNGVWFYPYKQREVIKNKVVDLLKNPQLLESKVSKGREKINQEHTWKQYAHALVEKLPALLEDLPYGLQQVKKTY